MAREKKNVTQLLQEWSEGDPGALQELMPLIYDELRRLARARLRRERPGHTLQPTALVNEVYLKLVNQNQAHWTSRSHFFAIAGQLMRRILVDHFRSVHRGKYPPPELRTTLDDGIPTAERETVDLLALDLALTKLEERGPRLARIVELRFFCGLTVEESATVLEVSEATIKREWKKAKAWLLVELSPSFRDLNTERSA